MIKISLEAIKRKSSKEEENKNNSASTRACTQFVHALANLAC